MRTKYVFVALLALALSATQAQSAPSGNWEFVDDPTESASSPRGEGAGEVDDREEERTLLRLFDRGLGDQLPVDYRGRIQLLGGYGSWKDDSSGTWQYEKLVANVLGRGRFVYGLTVKHEEYTGEKTETPIYEFNGEGNFAGLSGEYRRFGFNRWGFSGVNVGGTVGYALLESNGRKVDNSYFKDVETDATAGELYCYLHRHRGNSFVQMVSLEGSFRFDAGSSITRQSWDDDIPGNRTYREGRIRIHTSRLLWDSVSLNAGYKAAFEQDRHFLWGGGVVGLSLWDSVYADAEFLHGSSNAPYKSGWGVSVDIYKFGRGAWRTVRGWFGSRDSKPVQNDWQVVTPE